MNLAQVRVMVEVKPVQPAEGLSLSRWSRLKRRGADAALAPSSATVSAAPDVAFNLALTSASPSSSVELANVAELNLPELSSISLVEDFTPFMQARVPQALRQQALKALFKEPHFNVMDGLDIYIDDYTVFEPITPEVMATLSSWKTIMNPTQQVVTPGGYAVDVESDEGKAVLAARAEVDALAQGLSPVCDTPHPQGEAGPALLNPDEDSNARRPAPSRLAGEDWGEGAAEQAEHRPAMATHQHPRHNKRVGDFTYIEAPEVSPPGAEKAE